jgi:hypothetical protein
MECIIGDDGCKYMIVALLVFSSASYDLLTRMTPRSSTLWVVPSERSKRGDLGTASTQRFKLLVERTPDWRSFQQGWSPIFFSDFSARPRPIPYDAEWDVFAV